MNRLGTTSKWVLYTLFQISGGEFLKMTKLVRSTGIMHCYLEHLAYVVESLGSQSKATRLLLQTCTPFHCSFFECGLTGQRPLLQLLSTQRNCTWPYNPLEVTINTPAKTPGHDALHAVARIIEASVFNVRLWRDLAKA
jgi:hypothetical protein